MSIQVSSSKPHFEQSDKATGIATMQMHSLHYFGHNDLDKSEVQFQPKALVEYENGSARPQICGSNLQISDLKLARKEVENTYLNFGSWDTQDLKNYMLIDSQSFEDDYDNMGIVARLDEWSENNEDPGYPTNVTDMYLVQSGKRQEESQVQTVQFESKCTNTISQTSLSHS